MSKATQRTRFALLAATALLAAACLAPVQCAANLNWDKQVTGNAGAGTYIPRGLDVDQTNGDIYVAVDCTGPQTPPTEPYTHVLWLDKDGNQLGKFGPVISDAGGNPKTDLNTDLWGVALDPKTGYLYLPVDETEGDKNIGVIHVIDPKGTPAGVWVREMWPVFASPAESTESARCGGCAISRDGMLLTVAGYDQQDRGMSGAKLYTRNLRGTPTDWTDDTWDFAANLYASGGMRGLGDHAGWVSSPRDVCFDSNNCVYIVGDPMTPKYSGTAPYNLVAEFGLYRGRFGVDTDGSDNIVCCYGADDAGKRVWVTNQDGLSLAKILPANYMSGLAELYSVACDRLNNRIIAAGADSTKDYGVVNSYSVPIDPINTFSLKGRVIDSDGNPVRNISLGYGRWYHSSSWLQLLEGKRWTSLATDENGYFAVPVPDQWGIDWNPCVIEIDAPGCLVKRLYNQTIYGAWDTDLGDIVLRKNSSVDQLTWTPLVTTGTSGMVYRAGTDDGILTMAVAEGGRSVPSVVNDVNCFAIGARNETSCDGNVSFDNYLMLDVDDDWWTPGSPVWITVEYLDESSAPPDRLGIDADLSGVNPVFGSLDIGSIYKTAPLSSLFKSFTFKADKATFAGMATDGSGTQYGDIRINAYRVRSGTTWLPNSRREWIKSVTVSKVPPATPEPNSYGAIAAAKAAGPGPVLLTDKVMTAQWNGNVMYVEEPDRTSGIRVHLLEPWAENWRIGRSCRVYGVLDTDPATGEAYIAATGWSGDPSLTPPVAPFGVIGKSVANTGAGAFLTALKTSVWGTVSETDIFGTWFKVNDGSEDVKVVIDASVTLDPAPTAGDFVSVVGIATLEGSTPESATRIIKPWAPENVSILVDVP